MEKICGGWHNMVQKDADKPPQVPRSITSIRDASLRRRAREAWRAGHELLGAIDELEPWLMSPLTDPEAGERIIQTGRTAIRELCELKINSTAFMANDPDHLLRLWPMPPSEILDPDWYGDQDPNIRKEIAYQRCYAQDILRPELLEFLYLLEKHPVAAMQDVKPESGIKPEWDRSRGELRFRGEIIKIIRKIGQAKHVIPVLNAFQEANWPNRMDDPLPGGPDDERLRDTVKSLNSQLTIIRFSADGTGQGFVWERVEEN